MKRAKTKQKKKESERHSKEDISSSPSLSDESSLSMEKLSFITTPGFAAEPEFVDWIYRPRTVSILVAAIILIVSFAYSMDENVSDVSSIKIGMIAFVSAFLLYCTLQLRDGILIRPHPAVWRFVQGVSILYMCLLAFILFQPVQNVRRWFFYIYPDLHGQPLEERPYAEHCDLYTPNDPESSFRNIRDVFFDRFLIAHAVGYWAKAIVFRDMRIIWFLSVFWEVIEISTEHWMENFKECWWDHIIVDVLTSNALGCWLGMLTLDHLSMKKYNWAGVKRIHTVKGKVSRLIAQFSPYSWQKYEWDMFANVKNFLFCSFLVAMVFVMEMNGFLLKHVLFVPPEKPIHIVRLFIWLFLSIPAVRELYQFRTDPKCQRLGTNAWIALATITLEVVISMKFGRGMFNAPIPWHVYAPWMTCLILFPLWAFLYFRMKKSLKDRHGYLFTHNQWLNALFCLSFPIPFGFLLIAGCWPSIGASFNEWMIQKVGF